MGTDSRSDVTRNAQLRRILQSFPNSKWLENEHIHEFTNGQSAAQVLSASFTSHDRAGLNGRYLIKIDTRDWATREKSLDIELSKTPLRPFVAKVIASSREVEGRVGLAYQVEPGFLDAPSLQQLLLEQGESDILPYTIEEVVQQVLQFNSSISTSTINLKPGDMLEWMLGRRRMMDIHDRIRDTLPEWDIKAPFFRTGMPEKILPNPLAYLDRSIWLPLTLLWNCPVGYIHGDLHTGNILCNKHFFQIIDFSDYRKDGMPLYDLAYLEFDILRQSLPFTDIAQDTDTALLESDAHEMKILWWSVLTHIMRAIEPGYSLVLESRVEQILKLVAPLRRQVQIMIDGADYKSHKGYQIAWWMAICAVGLNYARKGHEAKSANERIAALFYAAFGLEHVLRLLKIITDQTAPTTIFDIPWIIPTAFAASIP